MTNETQPKPEQVWRDLRPDEVPEFGDRYSSPDAAYGWLEHQSEPKLNHIPRGTYYWQRPIPPGQCDCAGLRGSAQKFSDKLRLIHDDESYQSVWITAQNHLGRYSGPTYVDELERPRKALREPCTCAGKSAEHTCFFDADGSPCYICGKTFAQTLEDSKQGKSVEEWRDASLNSWKERNRALRLAELAEFERDEARRKLAELERWKREQMQVAADTHYQEIAKEIGVPLGHNIAPVILPAIKELKCKLAEAESKVAGLEHAFADYTHQAPIWRSYATDPPTEQDGVEACGYSHSVLARFGCDQMPWVRNVHFVPYGPDNCYWTRIIVPPLPELPQKPRQDADEALGLHEAWQKYEAESHCNTPLGEFEAGYRAALDFVRKQERK